MSVQLSIHPQDTNKPGGLRLKAGGRNPGNAQQVSIVFVSNEYYNRDRHGAFEVENEICAYNLSPEAAEALHLVAMMTDAQRAAVLPALREMAGTAE